MKCIDELRRLKDENEHMVELYDNMTKQQSESRYRLDAANAEITRLQKEGKNAETLLARLPDFYLTDVQVMGYYAKVNNSNTGKVYITTNEAAMVKQFKISFKYLPVNDFRDTLLDIDFVLTTPEGDILNLSKKVSAIKTFSDTLEISGGQMQNKYFYFPQTGDFLGKVKAGEWNLVIRRKGVLIASETFRLF